MGAFGISMTLDGKLTAADVKSRVREQSESDMIEYGSDPYNGSWSTILEVRVNQSTVFKNEREAMDYCLENAQKWEYAIAVQYYDSANVVNKKIEKLEKYVVEIKEKYKKIMLDLDKLVEDEVNAFLSKDQNFLTCEKCSSKLAVSELKLKVKNKGLMRCPLCETPYTSAGYRKKYEKINSKLNEVKSSLDDLALKIKKEKEDASKSSDNLKWLVAGWAAT